MLLASDGATGLLARGGSATSASSSSSARELARATTLLVAPGDLVPVDATLTSEAATLLARLDQRRERPRCLRARAPCPAGASTRRRGGHRRVAGGLRRASSLRASSSARRRADAADTSALHAVVAAPDADLRHRGPRRSRRCASPGWWGSATTSPAPSRSTTAVLVVTCPCAFGIATPLAYELVFRRACAAPGSSCAQRASSIARSRRAPRRVRQDRDPHHRLAGDRDPRRSTALSAEDRALLYDLVVRSTHPKSVAVRRALWRLRGAGRVRRHAHHPRDTRRSASSCAPRASRGDSARRVGGRRSGRRPGARATAVARATLETTEELRRDAEVEVAALRGHGREVWILSGDEPARVAAMARALGLPESRAVGGCSPTARPAGSKPTTGATPG
jgi:Cu2+-exporting ATPase